MRRNVTVGIVILLALSVPLIYLVHVGLQTTDVQFHWAVEVDDEFEFDIQVLGYMNNASEEVPFADFNNTRIVAKIVDLPNITLVNNETELIDVVNSLKVECRFDNGTGITLNNRHGYYERSNRSIPEIVSRAFLPVDGWSFIDSLFIDDDGFQGYPDWYFSRFEEDSFFMGYGWYFIDFGYGWKAHLNLTTGSPLSIEHWESDPICIGNYRVILSHTTNVNLRWGIEIGDEFVFDVLVFGSMSNIGDKVPLSEYNNTRIIATIVNLPNVTLVKNDTELIVVINQLKVECRFENGTGISVDDRQGFLSQSNWSIPEIVSKAFIPVDGWNFIDSLFIDDDLYRQTEWYFSRFEDESFFMGYNWFSYDYGFGWKAYLNMTIGIPLSLEFWDYMPVGVGQYQVLLFPVDS
ncbi:MAG: hypothetical protein ACFFDM_13405 [Candidatus Thorarchaeota archaeon]